MKNPIRIIVDEEFNKNQQVKLHDLYDLVLKNATVPSIDDTKKRHQVRSILDSLRRSGIIIRIAPETYKKIEKNNES